MMNRRLDCTFKVILLAGCLLAGRVAAQDTETVPEADSADVHSVDALIEALYGVISGPAGEERDWRRFRTLFTSGAHLVPVFVNQEGVVQSREMAPDEYVERAAPQFAASGFFEREVLRKEDRMGNLVQVFSTYESYRSEADAEPFMRGINSIQLIYVDGRWWITNIAWQPEQPGIPIPQQYLPAK